LWLILLAPLLVPVAAKAGPPFLTDDPEPTETGHWEIYAPVFEDAGLGSVYGGSIGVELNYGAAPDLQLTVGLPVSFAKESGRVRWGRGDIRASAKYRFFHDERAGISIAAFPGVSLPTANRTLGAGRVTALLPIWAQKSAGRWTLFGGGGYALNPGQGNRNYWTGGLAVTREFAPGDTFGIEADRQGADSVDGRASTSLGLGAIIAIHGPFRLLSSGGPTFTDGEHKVAFHAYTALGIDF
jgi:hypothetical protein